MVDLPRRLPDAAKFALCVAVGCAHILAPILDFANAMSPRSPAVEAAVAVAVIAVPVTYLVALVLLYPPGASRRAADLACALAVALLVALAAFLLLVAAGSGSPPSGGFTPT